MSLKLAVKTGLLLLLNVQILHAQSVKQTTTYGQTWLAAFTQARITNKLGIWADAGIYSQDHMVKNLFQSETRAGLIYYITDNTRLAGGYAFINNFPIDGHKYVSQPEHRLWEQVQWYTASNRLKFTQYVRFEQRYNRRVANDSTLADNYAFAYRARYAYSLSVPFRYINNRPSRLSFSLGNEIFINFGKQVVNNYFDQNRLFIGCVYSVAPGNNLQVGYMNLFQQLSSGNHYRMIHAFRIFYFNNIDWRRKPAQPKSQH